MGERKYIECLKSLAIAIGISKQVIFTGYIDDVGKLLSNAKIGEMPSENQESFGLAALKYMAWGLYSQYE